MKVKTAVIMCFLLCNGELSKALTVGLLLLSHGDGLLRPLVLEFGGSSL